MSLSERPVTNNVVQGPAKFPRLHLANISLPEPARSNKSSEWQEVDLRVPEPPARTVLKAPIPPPRKKRTNNPSVKSDENQAKKVKEDEAPKKTTVPETPAIYLEVDTPVAKHRKKSAPVLYKEPESSPELARKTEVQTDVLKLPRRSTSSMSLRSAPNRLDSEVDMLTLPKRSTSSMSLRSPSPVSEATAERLDNYLKSCRSFGDLRPEDVIDEMNQAMSDTDSNDSWAGLDDWDLGIVDHHGITGMSPPVTPTFTLPGKSPTRSQGRAEFTVGEPEKKKKKKDKKEREERRRRKEARREKKQNDLKKSGKDQNVSGRECNDGTSILSPPANFQADAKSYSQGGTSLIKPSQISVQDFLRQSNDKQDAMAREFGKLSVGPPQLTIDYSENSIFPLDYSKGLMPPRSPQIEIPGTPCSPKGLSRCSSPLPAMFMNNVRTTTPPSSPTHDDDARSWTEAENDTTTNLMRVLQEYHLTADVIGDRDAKKILQELGIPENLIDEIPELHKPKDKKAVETEKIALPEENGSSGLSSMTPSLTELEASLSELLEASAANGDDDEIEQELKNQTPQAVSVPMKLAENHFKPITLAELTEPSKLHEGLVNTNVQEERGTRITTTSEEKTSSSTTKTVEEVTRREIKSQSESKVDEGKKSNSGSLLNVN